MSQPENIKIEQIEDIYPLTIIQMRFGGKMVIFQMESDSKLIHDIQLEEEFSFETEKILEEKLSPGNYGIGETLWEAFEDFKKRYYKF